MLFFLSLLLHELGHSIISQRCGIPVPRITLLFIGGLAEISREPDDAKSELKIALGGPVVTVVLVALFATLAWLFGRANYAPASSVCEILGLVNAQLLAFNMIPGYPLDGGRVLRALIWAKTGRLRQATFITSRIGIGFSWLLVALGILLIVGFHQWTGLIFFLIAMFLKSAAHSGYANALHREVLGCKRVREIMTSDPVTIPASLPLNMVVDEYFLTNHHVAFPVCDEDGTFRGLLRLEMLRELPRERWPYVTAGDLVAEFGADHLGVEANCSAVRAMRRLLVPGSGRLAVLEDGRVVGVITRHDILHFIEIHNELED
jgi:Zn-dependent protease